MTIPVTSDEVYDLIAHYEARRPRSLQTQLGPSDISTPCARKIGYAILGVPEVAPSEVNLPAFVGSAIHERMEHVLRHANSEAKRTVWDIEQNVTLDAGNGLTIPCHIDAYNRDRHQVIDWKTTGPSAHTRYVAQTPDGYLTQTDLYALAKVLSGSKVNWVSVMYFQRNPVSGRKSLHMDTRPWTGERADAALKRYEALQAAVSAGPAVLPLLPTAHDCRFCPWWAPGTAWTDPTGATAGCPGHPETTVA